MKTCLLALASATVTAALALNAAANVQRPKILGVAHMAIYENDLAKARAFYEGFLGFAEPYALKRKNGSGDRIAFIKINDYQYLELFAEPPQHDGHLNHISFQTDDAEAMREYLASQGVPVPDKVGKGQIKNLNFNIKDPDNHTVEIVQYTPDGWSMQNKGKFMPHTRISDHMTHVGVTIGNLDASMKFYHGILGFTEFWRGAAGAGKSLSWVNMRVPDGTDYLELMLYRNYPSPEQLGTKNHVCLVVPDIEKAVATLKARPAYKDYGKEIKIQVGVNRKRQANLYDPDGTRIEVMEPNTIDGKPAPSSDAPAPVGQRPTI
ncbi:MAG: VOC family protein [Acidobacteriaceae bacterium]|nr:VOC family protein [Acidobacteriaceae bacterium]